MAPAHNFGEQSTVPFGDRGAATLRPMRGSTPSSSQGGRHDAPASGQCIARSGTPDTNNAREIGTRPSGTKAGKKGRHPRRRCHASGAHPQEYPASPPSRRRSGRGGRKGPAGYPADGIRLGSTYFLKTVHRPFSNAGRIDGRQSPSKRLHHPCLGQNCNDVTVLAPSPCGTRALAPGCRPVPTGCAAPSRTTMALLDGARCDDLSPVQTCSGPLGSLVTWDAHRCGSAALSTGALPPVGCVDP